MKQHRLKISMLMGMVLPFLLTACGGGSSGSSNQAPHFSSNQFTYSLNEDATLSGTIKAADGDGDELSYSVSKAGALGSLVVSADGSFTYQPEADKNGVDMVEVTVSDGKGQDKATLTFTIEPVNDAPVLATTQITVTAGSVFNGQLNVTDIDGDAITLVLVKDTVNGVLDLNLASGEFQYSTEATQEVNDTFIIRYTDGTIEPIEATITIAPSYATNADKLAYYYSWSGSHLAKANAALNHIGDDVTASKAKVKIAQGYYLGGLDAEGAKVLDGIAPLEIRAEGYQDSARVLNRLGHSDDANKLRKTAITLYNQYLAEKGIANIGRNDASFYRTVINDYRNAGYFEGAAALSSTVTVYAEAVRQEEYTTAYGHFLQALNRVVNDAVTKYIEDPTEANRSFAKKIADEYAVLADGTGYKYDADYPQPYTQRTKSANLTSAAEFYDALGESGLAKEYLARAISMFGEVTYDPKYNRAADQYAANTLDDWDTSLESLAVIFASQYPALVENVPAKLIFSRNPNDSSNKKAAENIFTVEAAKAVLVDGLTIDEATAEAERYFADKNDPQRYFWLLMELRGDPALASRLYVNGKTEAAREALLKARDVLLSQSFADKSRFTRYSSGNQGCDRLVQMYITWFGDASEMVQACQTLIDTLFVNEGKWATNWLIGARQDLLHAYYQNRAYADHVAPSVLVYNEMMTLTSDFTSPLDRIEHYSIIASIMGSYGMPNQSLAAWAEVEAEIGLMLADTTSLVMTDLKKIISHLLTFIVGREDFVSRGSAYSFREMYLLDNALRRNYGIHTSEEVSAVLSNFRASLKMVVTDIHNAAATFTVNEQQGVRENLIKLVQAAGLEDEAERLATDNVVNQQADFDGLWYVLAESFALIDDFPASNVANVDTDGDGLPNFFFSTATEEQILASGLEADTDADNDGIADEADTTPLESDLR